MLIIILAFNVFLLLGLFLVVTSKPSRCELEGSHVVVTGGSSGIGFEIAKLCASKGAKVSIIARNKSRLEKATKEIEALSSRSEGDQCFSLSVDISNSFSEVQAAFLSLIKKAGPIDILFNSAGTSYAAPFMEIPLEKFTSLMDVNYLGAVFCTRAALPGMKDRKKGRVVFVSSQAGQTGVYGYTGYSASKFALRGLAETLQMEVKHLNIGITVAFPPDTETPGFTEENLMKPLETKLISGNGVVFKADDVAASIVKDTLKGNFMSYMGLDGFILGHVTSGMAPCNSIIQAFIQLILMGIFRIISLGYLKSFNHLVKVCSTKVSKKD